MAPIFHFVFKKYLLKLSHQIPAIKTWKATGRSACIKRRAQAGNGAGTHQQDLEKCLVLLGNKGPLFLEALALGRPESIKNPDGRQEWEHPPAHRGDRHLTERVSGNENAARRLFILGSGGSVFTSSPGMRNPS